MNNRIQENIDRENFIFDDIFLIFDSNPIFKYGDYFGEINKFGEVLFVIKADFLYKINDDFYTIKRDNKWGLLDDNFNPVRINVSSLFDCIERDNLISKLECIYKKDYKQ